MLDFEKEKSDNLRQQYGAANNSSLMMHPEFLLQKVLDFVM